MNIFENSLKHYKIILDNSINVKGYAKRFGYNVRNLKKTVKELESKIEELNKN